MAMTMIRKLDMNDPIHDDIQLDLKLKNIAEDIHRDSNKQNITALLILR